MKWNFTCSTSFETFGFLFLNSPLNVILICLNGCKHVISKFPAFHFFEVVLHLNMFGSSFRHEL